ncbi:glycosyltransferase [Pseudanabaena sp. ABRG5-3]|uniref:glycosyltransferase n=1 Tax=Pseudanabaena sp. ABRG5-3 TaxID=685565 RepID=UPI000DC6E868|nr:glycosyltransferase [Pseudanabaena sp. ABRG5-3]BBC24671.1 glycosyl transferase group 1 [Pseudanabaena sp. ABRG5-3]
MRILITADPELPVPPKLYGGIERIVDVLVTGLQSLGHTVGLVAHHQSTSKADRLFSWRGQRSQSKFDTFQNVMTLWSAVQEFKPDVVHSFSRIFYMLPILRSPIPKIMSYQRRPSDHTVRLASQIAGKSLTFTGCSDHICQIGSKAGGTWQTIYNCVDLAKYTFQPKVSPDAPLVFLSRIERIKGAHTAIAIAKKTDKKLIIAGNYSDTGEEGKYWREQIEPNLDNRQIKYIGSINDEQKNNLLGQALAMVVPIEWEEPFGIVFAEALACGTPVISCPRGALPEIIRQEIDGYLIETIDEAKRAIHNISQIDRHNCRQRVEHKFSTSTVIKQYEQVYDTLQGEH